ncbi:1650_t:CDS:2, partial [Scutellospora calospora]
IKKESSIAMLKFKNSNIVLPSCYTLEGRILNNATKELHSELTIKANNNQMVNIIPKIITLLEDLQSKQIKVAAIISDSASAYAVASFYKALGSFLRSKASLISLAAKYVSPEDDNLTLPSNICEPIGDNNWWNTISELHILLAPLSLCLNQLQTDTARLYEEQPLLILSYLLHSDIHLTRFNLPIDDYRDEVFPFSKNEWNQFEGDILKYWKYCAEICYELSSVALRLHGILINSVSVERLFSSIGFFHTKERNRLSLEKVFNMSKLRASMLYKNRIEKIKNNINFINSNFAPPITKSLELDDNVELSNKANEEEDMSQLYEDEDELDIADSTTNLVVQNTTYPADNKLAKWKLEGLFVSDFVVPHYIIEAKTREVLRKQKKIEFIRNESTAEKENRTKTEDSYEDSINSISEEFMEED